MLYPTDFPLDSVRIIVDAVRNKSVAADRQKFAKASWELQGYALKSVFGEPDSGEIPFLFTNEPPLDEEIVADYLQIYTSHAEKGLLPLDLIALLPWRAILKWSLLRIAELL